VKSRLVPLTQESIRRRYNLQFDPHLRSSDDIGAMTGTLNDELIDDGFALRTGNEKR
jgi:hypothetical protein